MKTPIQKAIEFYQDIQLLQISKLKKENKELKTLLIRANCYDNCGIKTIDDNVNCDWCATRNKLLNKD